MLVDIGTETLGRTAQEQTHEETRAALKPYEEVLHSLAPNFIDSKARKGKSKFSMTLDQDGGTDIQADFQIVNGKWVCRSFRTEDPKRRIGRIGLNEQGHITDLHLDWGTSSDNLNLEDTPLRRLIQFEPKGRSPIKDISVHIKDPSNMKVDAYASYGEGALWNYRVEQDGLLPRAVEPFATIAKTAAELIIPQSILQKAPLSSTVSS